MRISLLLKKEGLLLAPLILAVGTWPPSTGAQEPATSKVVWERQFDEEISEVVFGEADDGSLYPRAIVFDEKVKYYDAAGKELWSVPYVPDFPPAVSRTGRYVGATRSYSDPGTDMGWVDVTWELHDHLGDLLAVLEYPMSSSGEWGYRVFFLPDADGPFVEGEPFERRLLFRELDGTVRKQIDLFEDDAWSEPGELRCALSDDGRHVAALASGRQRRLHLVLFDISGEELWRQPLMGDLAPSVRVFHHGAFVLGGSSDGKRHEVALYTAAGDLVGRYPGLFHDFSEDGESLVVADWNTVSLVETASGTTAWTRELGYQPEASLEQQEWTRITDVDISGDASLVVVSAATSERRSPERPAITRTCVEVLDIKGEEVGRVESTGADGELRTEAGSNGGEFAVFGSHRIARYAMAAE